MKDKKDWGPADYYADAQVKYGCFFFIVIALYVIYTWFEKYWSFD